jgi:hypothetical protein
MLYYVTFYLHRYISYGLLRSPAMFLVRIGPLGGFDELVFVPPVVRVHFCQCTLQRSIVYAH